MATLKWVVAIFLVFGVIDVRVVRARMAAPVTSDVEQAASSARTAKPAPIDMPMIRTSADGLLADVQTSAAEEQTRITHQSLSEYMHDTRNVVTEYDGRMVLVTGVVTGIFRGTRHRGPMAIRC
jgi:hypothetical protein